MNITELRDELKKILDVQNNETLQEALLRNILNDDDIVEKYLKLIDYDLEHDYLKDIYDSYFCDRGELNQDYTPQSLSRLIAKYALTRFEKGEEEINTVFDLCCGSGSLSIELWKLKKDTMFYMIELDLNSIAFLLLNLLINGINADVIHGNGLSFEFYRVFQVRNGKIIEINSECYKIPICDVAISNPPFNISFKTKDDYSKYCGYKQTTKANALFAIKCLEQIKSDGRVFYINSAGMRNHTDNTMYFRQYCIEHNILKGIIKLPKNLFINTPLPFEIWVFDKNKKDEYIYWLDNENKNFTKNYFELTKNTKYGILHMANRLYKSIKHYNGFTDEQIQLIVDTMESGQTTIEKYLNKIDPKDIETKEYKFYFEFTEPPPVILPPEEILKNIYDCYIGNNKSRLICEDILEWLDRNRKEDIFDSAIAYLEEKEKQQHQ